MESIVPHTLEEAYEVADAVENGDDSQIVDELGDLLFQVIFYCQIAAETDRFDIDDVVKAISDKLVRRHPHVFADAKVADPRQVTDNWETIKAAERGGAGALEGVPVGLPALSRAQKVQSRARRQGFDWPSAAGVWEKLEEELAELRSASIAAQEDELGDVLFTVVNLARHLSIDAERALRQSTSKFERRFRHVEAVYQHRGDVMREAPIDELERAWRQAKAADAQQQKKRVPKHP